MGKTLEEKRNKTEMVLGNIYNLPAAASIMWEVSKLLNDPATSTNALSKLIGKDQALSTKILSIANSPLYGLPRKVSTIDFAILIIGFQDIKNIVIALSMIESFKNKTDKNLDQQEFWTHSFVTASLAKRFAEDLNVDFSGEAFVVGLLHDLGISVMHKYFHSHFERIIENVSTSGVDYLTAEKEELGMDHQEVGAYLTEKWNLPDSLCSAIKYHHNPQNCENSKVLTSIVSLADFATQKLEAGSFYIDEFLIMKPEVLDILKFSGEEEMTNFINQYKNILTDEEINIKV